MKSRTRAIVLAVAVVASMAITAALGLYAGVNWIDTRERAETAEKDKDVAEKSGQVVATEGDDLAARVQAACRAGGDAAKALGDTNACAQANKTRKTIEDAPVDPTPQARTELVPVEGPRGPGPTLAQIGRAVDSAIDEVVSAQIDEAVAEQIGPALLAACGGSCVGRTGDTGAAGEKGDSITGPAGKDAPRVRSIACDGTTGVFTFTDDSTIRVSDMCDEPGLIEPDPEPAPEPTE